MLVVQQQKLHYLQLKIKYQLLVACLKKTKYDTKVSEFEKKFTNHDHDKYITTPGSNTLTVDVFNARLAQANLIRITDFDAKLRSLNRKIISNKSKQ